VCTEIATVEKTTKLSSTTASSWRNQHVVSQ